MNGKNGAPSAATAESIAPITAPADDGDGLEPSEAVIVIPPDDNEVDALAMEGLFASLGASTFSLELIGDERGRRFAIRARPPTLRYLKAQLGSIYGKVSFAPLEDDPALFSPDDETEIGRAVLRLKRPAGLSLRTFRDGDFEQADPIRGLLGAYNNFGAKEFAVSQLVLRPAPPNWERPHLHLAMNPNERLKVASPLGFGGAMMMLGLLAVSAFLLFMSVTAIASGNWITGILAFIFLLLTGAGWYHLSQRSKLTTAVQPQAVSQKLSSPAFEFQLRIKTGAPTYAQARARLLQIAAAYRQFNAGIGNTLGAVEASFNLRDFSAGWRRNMMRHPLDVLSTAEIASIWHLPVGNDIALIERVVSRNFTPLPAHIGRVADGMQLGVVSGDPAAAPVYLSAPAMRKHKLLVGKTQKGKSTAMTQLALHHIRQGEGVVYLDPHSDSVESLLGLIPRERIDDVVYMDFSMKDRAIGWNLLTVPPGASYYSVVESFLQAGESVWTDYWGPRMESALRFALLALTEANSKLALEEPEKQLTVLDVDAILSLGVFRLEVLGRHVDRIDTKRWFNDYFNELSPAKREDIINPVLTKIQRLTGSDVTTHILGQPQSSIDFDEIVANRRIVLVNLDVGSIGVGNTALLGTLFLTYLELAIRRQTAHKRNIRKGMAVIVDEFQQIPFNYSKLLAELQKMGASFTIGTQSLAQLDAVDPTLRGSLLGNVDTIISFNTSAMDAEILVPEFSGRKEGDPAGASVLRIKDFTNLPEHQCYLRTIRNGKPIPTLRVDTLPPGVPNPNIERAVRERMARYTRPIQEVRRIIDKHQTDWYRYAHTKYKQNTEDRNEAEAIVNKAKANSNGRGISSSAEVGAGDVIAYESIIRADEEIKAENARKGKRRSRSKKQKK